MLRKIAEGLKKSQTNTCKARYAKTSDAMIWEACEKCETLCDKYSAYITVYILYYVFCMVEWMLCYVKRNECH